ncbi:type IV toxin-antitoxin system AbiEi family antitoxin domain-containing protein [Mycobacterium sp. 1423905.2]|uniref:type IV toxin-antitoxin system AbiEi family antitoxin domain-containing protein n=1 Tax=Mycobacterium sp. 1423905.2 TaxID=1856859 RepID=UPI0007FCC26E|nr:type IV toxin-antitoxin system AbiEi family antitoxin domain-containing protein [Mycobacterium sp. 1423905.2]OBJ62318.1 hypothetical protein A9W95_08210 [Mycobacterium sp. 1423905.2]
MHSDAIDLLQRSGGFATTAQLLTVMTRQQLDVRVKAGDLVRVWHGVYAAEPPDLLGRLAALDVFMGQQAVACMGTAAAMYGFDTERTDSIHVLDPGVRMRPTTGLVVHQRVGARLQRIGGRLATAPAWTAVEVARQLRRPRALATLDAALHSMHCSGADLECAIAEQKGRRGIVAVRGLLPLADGRAESAMESEARLVMIDYGVPPPELQYPIYGPYGELFRVDFAWPEHRMAAEYESIDWHSGPDAMIRDKTRSALIQELGWTIIPIVVYDVRRYPARLAQRIDNHLNRHRSDTSPSRADAESHV